MYDAEEFQIGNMTTMVLITRPACRHCDDDDEEEEDEDRQRGRHVAPSCVQAQLFGVPASCGDQTKRIEIYSLLEVYGPYGPDF